VNCLTRKGVGAASIWPTDPTEGLQQLESRPRHS